MQPGSTLDPSQFCAERNYGRGGQAVTLAPIVHRFGGALEVMARDGLVKPTPSFGFAMANPAYGDLSRSCGECYDKAPYDDPYQLAWLVVQWGPDGSRYAANAVRKLRPAARERADTLTLRLDGSRDFADRVDSQTADGQLLWGDFPWGGARYTRVGGRVLLTAVSCYSELEDHTVAGLLAGALGAAMITVGGELPDD